MALHGELREVPLISQHRAFTGSGLRMIRLPASVTAIDGPDRGLVVAQKGGYACQ